jgi:V/A-type H+-transporting ATPase subunit I
MVKPLWPSLRNSEDVQALCFLLGAIHLSIAHIWQFLLKLPSVRAFSDLGWILMIWAGLLLANSLILNKTFPEFGNWFWMAGTCFIVLFTNPRKNPLKWLGGGIGDFLLHVVSSFTDVVSYIRLFAVGVASLAVADAFNAMAFSLAQSGLIFKFLSALVLLFGHALNILLCTLGIMVHGVRLNVLEFSSHLNLGWSGFEYIPFGGKESNDGYKSVA